MAEENNKYSQYTQGMTESQAAKFARLADIYESRFQYHGQTPGMEGVDADELSLSDYSQEIQNILSNSRFSDRIQTQPPLTPLGRQISIHLETRKKGIQTLGRLHMSQEQKARYQNSITNTTLCFRILFFFQKWEKN
jgi:hypothetical protein